MLTRLTDVAKASLFSTLVGILGLAAAGLIRFLDLLGTVLVAGWLGHRFRLGGRLQGLAPNVQ